MKACVYWADKLVSFAAVSFYTAMIVVVLIQVAGRTLPVTTPIWTEELSRFLMVFMASTGSIVAMSVVGGFIRVDIFVNLLPKKIGMLVEIVCEGLVCLFLMLMVQPSYRLMLARLGQNSPTLRMSMAIPQSAVFLAILGILVVGVTNVVRKITVYQILRTAKEV